MPVVEMTIQSELNMPKFLSSPENDLLEYEDDNALDSLVDDAGSLIDEGALRETDDSAKSKLSSLHSPPASQSATQASLPPTALFKSSILVNPPSEDLLDFMNFMKPEVDDLDAEKPSDADVPPSVSVVYNGNEYVFFDPSTDGALFTSEEDVEEMYLQPVNQFIQRIKNFWSIDKDVSIRFPELENLELREDTKLGNNYSLSILQNLQDLLSGSNNSHNFKPLQTEIVIHCVNTSQQLSRLVEKARFVFDSSEATCDYTENCVDVELDNASKRKYELDESEISPKKLRLLSSQPTPIARS